MNELFTTTTTKVGGPFSKLPGLNFGNKRFRLVHLICHCQSQKRRQNDRQRKISNFFVYSEHVASIDILSPENVYIQ